MKYVICNKETTIFKGKDSFISYFDLLSDLVGKTPTEGLTIIEMKKNLDLLEQLKTKEEIELNETDYQSILLILNETKFTIMHNDLVTFYDYFSSIKNVNGNGE